MSPTLEEVDNYQAPDLLIPRIAKVNNVSLDFAAGTYKEAKRFHYLYTLSKMSCAPSTQVDMAWHEMLVFTKFYQAFCAFLGTGFIHHDPTPGPPDGGKTYARTKENYKKYLGIDPDPKYWP